MCGDHGTLRWAGFALGFDFLVCIARADSVLMATWLAWRSGAQIPPGLNLVLGSGGRVCFEI